MATQTANQFGENPVVRWVPAGTVQQSMNGAAETLVLVSADEVFPQVEHLDDGRFVITYADGAGAVQRIYSTDGENYL